jgi:hypothetical protein
MLLIALFALSCKEPPPVDTDPRPRDCDTTDPSTLACSTDEECHFTCYCDGGSSIGAGQCEGHCDAPDTLCPTYCGGVGWTGLFCFEPR